MTLSQIRGLIVVSIFSTIIPLISLYFNYFQNYETPLLVNQFKNSIVIEIENKEKDNGIYFARPETTANQILSLIGCNFTLEKDFPLENAMKLKIDAKSSKKVSVSSIDNSSRLALGMPIDLNLATEDDLLLISGIGEVTAQKILELRNKKIHFRKIEELMEIKGIKEKRLAKLKPYLFVHE
jgi:competence protein ComEA